MFESLDDQMKHDDTESSSASERWIRNASIVIVSLLVFGGLYAGLMFME